MKFKYFPLRIGQTQTEESFSSPAQSHELKAHLLEVSF